MDPARFKGDWIQIGSDMGQMLFYHAVCNEFGDQLMAGNTQDIDGQTYRYGRWGKWRGYEGSECFINPYLSTVYLPSLGARGLDLSMVEINSWEKGTSKADVVTGSWFLLRAGGYATSNWKTLLRCDDQGQKLVSLDAQVGGNVNIYGSVGLCRDKGRSTVYVVNKSGYYYRSTDGARTFEPLRTPAGAHVRFSSSLLATDPDNSDVIYVAQKGKVHSYNVVTGALERLGGTSLPDIPVSNLIFHEGSGDLYYYHSASAGIYILEYNRTTGRYADAWRFWTKGYNPGKSNNIEINYTTQEIMLSDYGHGVWVADLEHPADRFFRDGFNLKELSFKDGRRTIGIDTEWTIPLYYYYEWRVNDEIIDNPYQYLRRRLNPGDRVQLRLTLRESPDVSTLSSVFIVPEVGDRQTQTSGEPTGNTPEMAEAKARTSGQGAVSYDNPVARMPGRALYSNGRGRVDLGYVDYFFNDFTIDFWLKPNTNGTILANTTRYSDAKGWELSVDGGMLRFQYYPMNQFILPLYEPGITQTAVLRGGPLTMDEWNHVAVTHERNGSVSLYVNGRNVATGQRILPAHTLNNSSVLSLFADAIELHPIKAAVDELKIWSKALSEEEVRREMYSANADNQDGLKAYYQFNTGALVNEFEAFTRRPVRSKVLAEVEYPLMSVPICARKVVYDLIDTPDHVFASGDVNFLGLSAGVTPKEAPAAEGKAPAVAPRREPALAGNVGFYAYDAAQWQNEEDNLDTDYFHPYPVGYLIHPFGSVQETDGVSLEFYPSDGDFDPTKQYRLYAADINAERQDWAVLANLTFDAGRGTLSAGGLNLSQIVDKKLLIVSTLPSIEVVVNDIKDGFLDIFDDSQTTFPLSANVLSGLEEPSDIYQIEADGVLRPSGIYFTEGKATGELRLDLSKLGPFNSAVSATLRSTDNALREDSLGTTRPSLIPLTINVRNRIVPKTVGTALKIEDGAVEIVNGSHIKELHGSRNFTLAGWVRVDSIQNLMLGNLFTLAHDDNKMSGVRVQGGNICFLQHNTPKKGPIGFTAADLGQWAYVGVVLDSAAQQFRLYFNGAVYKEAYTNIPPLSKVRGIAIGKLSQIGSVAANSDSFFGAIDQFGVWNRALSDEEIIRNMYTAPSFQDPSLVSYLTMDYTDADGVHRDACSLSEITPVSAQDTENFYHFGEPTAIPYDARAFNDASAPDSPVGLTFAAGKARGATVATFRGTPYCYLNHDFQQYTPLSQEYYTVTYHTPLTAAPAEGEIVTVTYRHRLIHAGDRLAVAMRKAGNSAHLAGFIHAASVADGSATFDVPATFLTHASEIMFFTYPESDEDGMETLPAGVHLAFATSILPKINTSGDVPRLILPEGMDSIPIIADILRLPRNNDAPLRIVVNETSYASPSKETIDVAHSENRFNINLDLSKIDPFGINPLTINIEGAEANEIKLNFSLEPFVRLELLNGADRETVRPGTGEEGGQSDPSEAPAESPARRRVRLVKEKETDNSFRTLTPVATLKVSAELLQGHMPEGEDVRLEVITDLDHALNIGNGSLLNNDKVDIENLDYTGSDAGARYEGWNLIGNPYLTNINLTKSQNVEYDPERVTKFMYQSDPATGNYRVYDMTDYDGRQQIRPFQSYFVQTMADNAAFSITPVAKEAEPSKRTMAYKAVERAMLVLSLLRDGKEFDNVSLGYSPDASADFVINEDAPKLWNLTGTSPELYAMTADGAETAVNAANTNVVTLGLRNPADGKLTLSVKSDTGLPKEEIIVHDNVTGTDWKPATDGSTYTFDAPEGRNDNRFTVTLMKDIPTGTDGIARTGYQILTEEDRCIIQGLKGNALVNVFTPSGLQIMGLTTGDDHLEIMLDPGVYMIVIRENGKDYTAKIKI